MIRELIISVVCIIGALIGVTTSSVNIICISMVALIIIGMYSGYKFKCQNNIWYALGVFGAFLVFMASPSIGGWFCTGVLFVFFGLVCYLAWYANAGEIKPQPQYKPGTIVARCLKCGAIKSASDQFCPNCGADSRSPPE